MKIELNEPAAVVLIVLIICASISTCYFIDESNAKDYGNPNMYNGSSKGRKIVYKNYTNEKEEEHIKLRKEFIEEFGDKGLTDEDIDYMYDDDVKKELLRHKEKQYK
jgi:hypothetical protein